MSRIRMTMTALLLAACVSCKREAPKAAVMNRPAATVPTTQEIITDKQQEIVAGLEPFIPLEMTGVVTVTPDKVTWVRYANGIMINEIRHAEGRKPAYGQTAAITYVGMYPGTNKVFDQHTDKENPFTFVVGSKSIIRGFSIALNVMAVGSHWQVFIPASLAYGDFGDPAHEIPGNQALIFDIEMLNVTGESVDMPVLKPVSELMQMGPPAPEAAEGGDAATQSSTRPATQPGAK